LLLGMKIGEEKRKSGVVFSGWGGVREEGGNEMTDELAFFFFWTDMKPGGRGERLFFGLSRERGRRGGNVGPPASAPSFSGSHETAKEKGRRDTSVYIGPEGKGKGEIPQYLGVYGYWKGRGGKESVTIKSLTV